MHKSPLLLISLVFSFALAACTFDDGYVDDEGSRPGADAGGSVGNDAADSPWIDGGADPRPVDDAGADPWPRDDGGVVDPWPTGDAGVDPWPRDDGGVVDPWPTGDAGVDPWPIEDGGAAPSECASIDREAVCVVTPDCTAQYEGRDCRCTADGRCECSEWVFTHCE